MSNPTEFAKLVEGAAAGQLTIAGQTFLALSCSNLAFLIVDIRLNIMIVVTAALILCGASWHDEESD